MISLQINGKRVELEQPMALLAYLEQLGVNPRAVAVEPNTAMSRPLVNGRSSARALASDPAACAKSM